MRSPTYAFATVVALLTPALGSAAELMLRPEATQQGPIVRLGDVADISASASADVRRLATTPLMPSPAKGTEFFLTVEKLRDLLGARGIDASGLTIGGAIVVRVGEAAATTSVIVKLEESMPQTLDVELVAKQAIERRLREMDESGRWRVDVSLTQMQIKHLQSLPAEVTAHELQIPRTGRVRFELSDGQQNWTIAADLVQIRSVVVAKQPIERGQLVRAVDVEERELEGNLPVGFFSDAQMVIGQVAERGFKADDVIRKTSLRAPWQVRRGETVNAFVRTGNIVVRSRAIAKQNGAMGDLIAVETLSDKQRLDVTVSGPNEVTVYATGGSAIDYASLSRDDTRRR
ncbi:MAG: flagellar basal body P-ring formation chaperone FlgA [Planctomycetota bacterium]